MYVYIFWLSDLLGSATGFVLNVLLLMTVLASSRKTRRNAYSWMVLVVSAQDTLFCLLELHLQHVMCMKKGTFYIFGHGIEQHLPLKFYYVTFFLHALTIVNMVTFLPAMFHFRYYLMKHMQPEKWRLVLNVVTALFFSSTVGFSVCWCYSDMSTRGRGYYIAQLSDIWFDESGRTAFVYATDIKDTSTKVFMLLTTSIAGSSVILMAYYGWKAYRFVNPVDIPISENTKVLQRQFARSLIAQSVYIGTLTNAPVVALVYCTISGIDSDYTGFLLMAPLSWVSATNAIITFIFMPAYRMTITNGDLFRRLTGVFRPQGTEKIGSELMIATRSSQKADYCYQ